MDAIRPVTANAIGAPRKFHGIFVKSATGNILRYRAFPAMVKPQGKAFRLRPQLFETNAEFLQLPGVNRPGRLGHQTDRLLGLREGNHVPNRIQAEQEHGHAVQPDRNASVRRSAIFQGIQEEAELDARLVVGDVQKPEDALLHLGIVLFTFDLVALQGSPWHIPLFWVATGLLTAGCILTFYLAKQR